jgi:hypothetical protein
VKRKKKQEKWLFIQEKEIQLYRRAKVHIV